MKTRDRADKRAKTEEQLRPGEDRWRSLIETSAAWIWETDANIRHTYTNAFVVSCLGYEPSEFLSLDIPSLVHPDDRGKMEEIVRSAVELKTGWTSRILRWRHKDGSWKYIESSGSAFYDRQGRLLGLRGIDRDITERLRTEEKLRQSEAALRDAQLLARIGSWRYEVREDRIRWSDALYQVFGIDPSVGALTLPVVLDRIHPDDRATFLSQVTSREPHRSDYRVVMPDGTVKHVHEEVRVERDEEGLPACMYGTAQDITEQKLAEEALRRSMEVMEKTFHSLDSALFILDNSSPPVITDCNPAATSIFGYGKEDMLGRTTAFLHADSRSLAEFQKANHAAIEEQGYLSSFEFRMKRKNGDLFPSEHSVFPLKDKRGARTGWVSVVKDITGRRRAEEELRQSEEKFRALVETSYDWIWEVDAQGVYTYASPRVKDVLGYTPGEVVGKTPFDFMPPDERARVSDRFRELVRKREPLVGLENTNLHKGGRGIILETSGMPIFDAAGTFKGYRGIDRDITQRKQAERQLAESKNILRNVIDAIPVRVFWKDRESRYLGCNMLFAQDAGRPGPESLLGQDDFHMGWAEQAEAYRADDSEVMRTGIPKINYEEPQTTPTGDRIWLRTSKIPLRDEGGSIYGILGTYEDITARKRMEEALRESEEQYRRLVQAANSVILTWDTSGNVLFINEFGERFFGFDKEDLIGRNVVGTIVPERETSGRDLVLLMQEIQEAPDRYMDNENENITKSGTRVWVRWANKAITDQQGNLVGILSVGNDITGRKRAEEALQRSERMLQTIIDAEPECVKLIDENANLIMMNRAGLDMIQAESLDQMKGQCLCPMIGTEDRDAFMDLTRRVFRGESGRLIFEMAGLKGRRLWLETHAVPLRNEKDEITALLGVTRDITERRRALEALQASESRFRAIIEHASSGILVADMETARFLYANPEICRMLGYESSELLKLSLDALHPADELPKVRKSFASRQGTQTLCLRRNGTVFPVEIRAVEVELDRKPCLVGFFTDVTEKRLLEEERVKTEKLESIGTLAGGIAHDFNNLLQGVFGYISIAKMTLDRREEALAMLGQAEKALHQTVNLTSQLLTFSKGGKPVKKLIDLRRVVETAAAFSLSGSRTGYQATAEDDLWSVEADEGQIVQVVQNIVLNADQAMPEGGTVRISARNIPEGNAGPPQGLGRGNYVGLSISDSGIGIPAEYLTKIFDPYFTTKEKGSGLGLATSYSIIKNHGGAIAVRSTPGSGTTFTLYLPAAAERVAREQDRPVPASGRPGRVLVMDDEEVVRRVTGELLEALGHDVEVAEHGEAALERYQEARAAGKPFDVVILDLTIRGGMGGAETMEKLLAIDPGVKAVVSSGYSDDAVISRYREKGFRAFLKKPYDLVALQSILNDLTR